MKTISSPALDPHPIGQAGFSVYAFTEHKRTQTPCGGWVPTYPCRSRAVEAMTSYAIEQQSDAVVVRPDRGAIFKLDTEGGGL